MNDIEIIPTVEQKEQIAQLLDTYGINSLNKETQIFKKTGRLNNCEEALRKVLNFCHLIVIGDNSLDMIDDYVLDKLQTRASNEVQEFADFYKKKKRA